MERATDDAVNWLDNDQECGRKTETLWLRGFSAENFVTGNLIKKHKAVWQIRGVKGEPYEDIAKLVQHEIKTAPDPARISRAMIAERVASLAERIGTLAVKGMSPYRSGKPRVAIHLSWASKILHHCWPDVRTFIWDSYVRLVLGARTGGQSKADKSASYRYEKFLDECEKYFDEIKNTNDFRKGMQQLITKRRKILEHSGNRFKDMESTELEKVSISLLERRLFDKFVWHQGDFIFDLEKNILDRDRA
jgi:hypothetical protein